MAYAAISKPSLHMNIKLYTGTGSGGSDRQITGVGFQPDLVWIKNRDSVQEHVVADAVRGATKSLTPDTNEVEATNDLRVGAFISDGFQLGSGAVQNRVNENGSDMVAWNWKANGVGSANTDGSINSTVSVNATAGFSIVSYVGDYTAGSTVGHGLGTTPTMYIIKNREGVEPWLVYHQSLGNTKGLYLNTNGAATTNTVFTNNTSPTSSVFSVGAWEGNNGSSQDMIAYCFTDVSGYSKFGSYIGNGSTDGTFVYTGFKPSWVIIKDVADATSNWMLRDNKMSPFNPVSVKLCPDLPNAQTDASWVYTDFLSNGFKLRTSEEDNNTNTSEYIYMAFAAEPLVANVGTGIPATAE